MGAIRTCCGVYCAFNYIMNLLFFFIVTIILELTKNQFTLYKLQEFEYEVKDDKSFYIYEEKDGIQDQADAKVQNRVISMAIAIAMNINTLSKSAKIILVGLQIVFIFICIGCIRIGANKNVEEEEEQATQKIA